MENIQNINTFTNANNLQSDDYGNYSFEAFVEYRSDQRGANEVCNVRIILAGYNGGKIELEEKGDFKAEDYHLDFNNDYQKYSYDDDSRALIVKGQSSKLGKYKVSIKVT